MRIRKSQPQSFRQKLPVQIGKVKSGTRSKERLAKLGDDGKRGKSVKFALYLIHEFNTFAEIDYADESVSMAVRRSISQPKAVNSILKPRKSKHWRASICL